MAINEVISKVYKLDGLVQKKKCSIEKYKSSKPPWNSISHPLGWLPWKKITNVGKNVQKLEPLRFVSENEK